MALALESIGWGTAEHWMRMQASYDLACLPCEALSRCRLTGLLCCLLCCSTNPNDGWTWCYGLEGSLVVHVGHGTWYDHKAGVGGDPLDLVKHVLRRDEANALRWLKDKGLIDYPQHGREAA